MVHGNLQDLEIIQIIGLLQIYLGVPNIDYPAFVGKKHGNTTGTKLSSAVTFKRNKFIVRCNNYQ